MRRGRVPLAVGILIATAVSLGVGFWVKDRCTTHVWDGYQYRTSCYNDVFALYSFRGLNEGRFPYLDGDGRDETGSDGDLEYPVGTGLYIGAIARAVADGQAFFRANAAGLAAAGFAISGLLLALARDRRRVLAFALGPPLALYAFHNWDLLAVAMMIGALVAYRERSDLGTGLLIGVGAATKLFPGALLPVLVFTRRRETGRVPWRMVAWSAVGFLALNLPILIANPRGWLYPWRFQSTRFPNFETSWYMLYRHAGGSASADSFWWTTFPQLTGWVSGGLFLAGLGWLIAAEMRRERVRPYALAFGAMILFLLTAKVYSPQFALWLLPFFAIVRLPWTAYAAFLVTDAAVWFAISAWFLSAPPISAGDPGFRFLLVEIAVWVRYAVLVWMLWLTRRAEENVEGAIAAARPAGQPVGYPA